MAPSQPLPTGTVTFLFTDIEGSTKLLNSHPDAYDTARGGQTVLSGTVVELVRDYLPASAALKDLGEHHLKDLVRPEHIYQLSHPDLPSDFPPLRTLDNPPNDPPRQPIPSGRKGGT